jgi:hypothetical protein
MSVPVPDHPGYQCLADQLESELTAAEQYKLLELLEEAQRRRPFVRSRNPFVRSRNLTLAVLQKLKSSTARAGAACYQPLVERRLAIRKPNGLHEITSLGSVMAGSLARKRARQLEITVPEPRRRHGGFGPGFSQAGNW